MCRDALPVSLGLTAGPVTLTFQTPEATMAKAAPTEVISHWSKNLEGLTASPMDFYASVEAAIEKRQLPDAKRTRVDWREGGILSAKREYLRVRRKEYVFDICGAPFGSGFFVSSWLGEVPSGLFGILSQLPVVGRLFDWFAPRDTYYRTDTAMMFQSAVHGAVMEVVDQMTSAKGLRALSETERLPTTRDLFRR